MASSSARSLPSLKSIAHAVLRPLWHTVDDVGDASFDLLRDLLAQSTATQLHAIEEASPHLIADTEGELAGGLEWVEAVSR